MYCFYCRVCREQWIRAKYERKEFVADTGDAKPGYMTGAWHTINSMFQYFRLPFSILRTSISPFPIPHSPFPLQALRRVSSTRRRRLTMCGRVDSLSWTGTPSDTSKNLELVKFKLFTISLACVYVLAM